MISRLACRLQKYGMNLLFPLALLFFLFPCEVSAGSKVQPSIHLSSTSLFPGDVALISVTPADALVSGHITWDQKRIPLERLKDKKSFAAFFAVPQNEAAGPRKMPITLVRDDGKHFQRILDFKVLAKEFSVQHLTLPKEKVTLSKKNLDRHQREKTTIEKALARPLAEQLWQLTFIRPVPGEVATPFGVRRVLNGQPRSSHSGVDLRGHKGEPVASAGDGIVILTGEHFFAGKSVYIDHGMGIVTMYFHLSGIEVKQGDRVHGGQTIGLLGSTGRSTGPHLHWGLRVHNQPADPFSLLALFPLRE